MYQNQSTDNDLQKAIDDITNTTNIDPVFSDPVAAPSSIPEGDTGELDEAIGPFPEPRVEMVTPGPEPIAPFESINIPELSAPEPAVMPGPMPMPTSAEMTSTPEPIAPPAPVAPEPQMVTPPAPAMSEPQIDPQPVPSSFSATNLSTRQVKEAALRDLIPLLSHLNMTPSQKFNICRNIFEDLHDYAILDQAYHAATEIANETERAEALLYLVESIDKM